MGQIKSKKRGAEKMKKSFKSLIIALIIVMCIVVLTGCVTRSRMVDKPTNLLMIRMTDGNVATYERGEIKNIEETKNLIILTVDYGNGVVSTVVFNKENIIYVAYA